MRYAIYSIRLMSPLCAFSSDLPDQTATLPFRWEIPRIPSARVVVDMQAVQCRSPDGTAPLDGSQEATFAPFRYHLTIPDLSLQQV